MEYQFIDDPITGSAMAKFSLEHEIIGPWLEVEVGDSQQKLSEIFSVIADIEQDKKIEETIVGVEYSVIINRTDVVIQTNASMSPEVISEALQQDNIDYDQQESSSCGNDDFRDLLLAWQQFAIKN